MSFKCKLSTNYLQENTIPIFVYLPHKTYPLCPGAYLCDDQLNFPLHQLKQHPVQVVINKKINIFYNEYKVLFFLHRDSIRVKQKVSRDRKYYINLEEAHRWKTSVSKSCLRHNPSMRSINPEAG